MKQDQSPDPETIVNRSREISEDRWPDIKGELDSAKGLPVAHIPPCNPLIEVDERSTTTPLKAVSAE